MPIVESEFVCVYGTTVKLHLREPDGTFKNHYHRYKTKEKAEYYYEIFRKAIDDNVRS